jgi:hypothetical protein
MSLRGEKYAKDTERVAFLFDLENRLQALPNVERVAIGSSQPAFGFNSSSSFIIEGQPNPSLISIPKCFTSLRVINTF